MAEKIFDRALDGTRVVTSRERELVSQGYVWVTNFAPSDTRYPWNKISELRPFADGRARALGWESGEYNIRLDDAFSMNGTPAPEMRALYIQRKPPAPPPAGE